MFDILENKAPKNAEHISEERLQKIKTSVLSQVLQDKPDKEEKTMKKRTTFKALLVAAAVMTTGAVSVIGASAEMNRTATPIAPPAQVDDATPAASKPAETPKAPEITDIFVGSEKPDIVAISEKYTNSDAVPGLTSFETSGISNLTETETEINGCKVTVIKYEVDGKKMKMIRQTSDNMELIDVKEDGTHVYKTFSGGTFKEYSSDGIYGDGSGSVSMLYHDF